MLAAALGALALHFQSCLQEKADKLCSMLRILFDMVLDFSFCCQEKFLESDWVFIVSFCLNVSMNLNRKNTEAEMQEHQNPGSTGVYSLRPCTCLL